MADMRVAQGVRVDENEGWKITLARELKAAGMEIDLARAMGV